MTCDREIRRSHVFRPPTADIELRPAGVAKALASPLQNTKS
jgi:hypothetical protein